MARVTNGAHSPMRTPDTTQTRMLFLETDRFVVERWAYALPSRRTAIAAQATPAASTPALPFGCRIKLETTPTTRAMPMETGKAVANPAMSMPATKRRFARLKMAPPRSVETMLEGSAARTLFRKLAEPLAALPMAKHTRIHTNKIPNYQP